MGVDAVGTRTYREARLRLQGGHTPVHTDVMAAGEPTAVSGRQAAERSASTPHDTPGPGLRWRLRRRWRSAGSTLPVGTLPVGTLPVAAAVAAAAAGIAAAGRTAGRQRAGADGRAHGTAGPDALAVGAQDNPAGRGSSVAAGAADEET